MVLFVIFGSVILGRLNICYILIQLICNNDIGRCGFVILIADLINNRFTDLHKAQVFYTFIGFDFPLRRRLRHWIDNGFGVQSQISANLDLCGIFNLSGCLCAVIDGNVQFYIAFCVCSYGINRPRYSTGLFVILSFWSPSGRRSRFKRHVVIKFISDNNLCPFCFIILILDSIANFLADFHGAKFTGTVIGINFLHKQLIWNRILNVIQFQRGIVVYLYSGRFTFIDNFPWPALAFLGTLLDLHSQGNNACFPGRDIF